MTPSNNESLAPGGTMTSARRSETISPFRVSSENSFIATMADAEQSDDRLLERKDITYWQGMCLVISREIGAGIFSTPSIVNANAGSVGTALIIWFTAGCLSYAGACTNHHPLS
jgi:hypothetical protein